MYSGIFLSTRNGSGSPVEARHPESRGCGPHAPARNGSGSPVEARLVISLHLDDAVFSSERLREPRRSETTAT